VPPCASSAPVPGVFCCCWRRRSSSCCCSAEQRADAGLQGLTLLAALLFRFRSQLAGAVAPSRRGRLGKSFHGRLRRWSRRLLGLLQLGSVIAGVVLLLAPAQLALVATNKGRAAAALLAVRADWRRPWRVNSRPLFLEPGRSAWTASRAVFPRPSFGLQRFDGFGPPAPKRQLGPAADGEQSTSC